MLKIVEQILSSHLLFQMNEIGNDDGLESLSASQRNCWFPSEFSLPIYRSYSYSACIVTCRAFAQQRLCNCTNHLLPEIRKIQASVQFRLLIYILIDLPININYLMRSSVIFLYIMFLTYPH